MISRMRLLPQTSEKEHFQMIKASLQRRKRPHNLPLNMTFIVILVFQNLDGAYLRINRLVSLHRLLVLLKMSNSLKMKKILEIGHKQMRQPLEMMIYN